MPPKATGLTRVINAFGYSVAGFKACFASEAAFRQELALFAIGLPLALWLDVTTVERLLLIGSMLLVLIVELLNTGLETAIERISSDIHDLSKKTKDLGSAAVFLSLINAGMVWVVILLA